MTPAWHDLHNDFADLPSDHSDKWCITEHKIYCVAFYDWRLDAWIGTDLEQACDIPVRAWCDLPEFEGVSL